MDTYKRLRFPPVIIGYAVWLCHRFSLSHRDIEVLLADGSAAGLTTAGLDDVDQFSTGDTSTGEEGDGFGSALVAGDSNGDNYEDLLVGVPGEAIGSLLGAGMTNVIL